MLFPFPVSEAHQPMINNLRIRWIRFSVVAVAAAVICFFSSLPMLQPPGAARNRPTGRSRKSQQSQVSPDDAVRQRQRLPANKKCADCQSKLPSCVNLTIGSFVCITCAGIHRELNARVKGVGHSSFTAEEAQKLSQTDNDQVNALYLARYDPHRERMHAPRDNSNPAMLKEWIRRKYFDKAWMDRSRPAEPQATVVQVPPQQQAPQQPASSVDLLGGGGGWDAFGSGGGGAPQSPKPQQQVGGFANFANFPTSPAAPQQQNFASFSPQQQNRANAAAPSQQPVQQSPSGFANFPPQQPQVAFANFGQAQSQPPQQAQAQGGFANFPTGQQGHSQPPPQQQQVDFANFPTGQQGHSQPPQQSQSQSQDGFANFPPGQQGQSQPPQQHGNFPPAQGQLPPAQGQSQGGFANFPPGQQGQSQPPQQQHSQGGFANFPSGQQGQLHPQQQSQGGFANFPPGQQGQPHPPQQQQSQGGFANFPPAHGQLPPAQSQSQAPQQQSQQQQSQGGFANVAVPAQQGQHLSLQRQPAQDGFVTSQQPGQQHMSNGFDSFPSGSPPQQPTPSPQQQQQSAQSQSSFMTSAPQQQMAMQTLPQNVQEDTTHGQRHPQQGTTSHRGDSRQGSGTTVEPSDAFDHFAAITIESTPNQTNSSGPEKQMATSATGPPDLPSLVPPDSTTDKPAKSMPQYEAGQKVYYKSSSYNGPASIVKVHLDDDLEPFYTIKVQGREKQTDHHHLMEKSPVMTQLETQLVSLSDDQLRSVLVFVQEMQTDSSIPSTQSDQAVTRGAPASVAGFQSAGPEKSATTMPVDSMQSSAGAPSSGSVAPTNGSVGEQVASDAFSGIPSPTAMSEPVQPQGVKPPGPPFSVQDKAMTPGLSVQQQAPLQQTAVASQQVALNGRSPQMAPQPMPVQQPGTQMTSPPSGMVPNMGTPQKTNGAGPASDTFSGIPSPSPMPAPVHPQGAVPSAPPFGDPMPNSAGAPPSQMQGQPQQQGQPYGMPQQQQGQPYGMPQQQGQPHGMPQQQGQPYGMPQQMNPPPQTFAAQPGPHGAAQQGGQMPQATQQQQPNPFG